MDWFNSSKISITPSNYGDHLRIGTVEIEFLGEPSTILSL